jgi:hypothetical protein
MAAQEKKITAQEIPNGCAEKNSCAGKFKRVRTHWEALIYSFANLFEKTTSQNCGAFTLVF